MCNYIFMLDIFTDLEAYKDDGFDYDEFGLYAHCLSVQFVKLFK